MKKEGQGDEGGRVGEQAPRQRIKAFSFNDMGCI